MFKDKFLENDISYSSSFLIRYGLCNGPSSEMVMSLLLKWEVGNSTIRSADTLAKALLGILVVCS